MDFFKAFSHGNPAQAGKSVAHIHFHANPVGCSCMRTSIDKDMQAIPLLTPAPYCRLEMYVSKSLRNMATDNKPTHFLNMVRTDKGVSILEQTNCLVHGKVWEQALINLHSEHALTNVSDDALCHGMRLKQSKAFPGLKLRIAFCHTLPLRFAKIWPACAGVTAAGGKSASSEFLGVVIFSAMAVAACCEGPGDPQVHACFLALPNWLRGMLRWILAMRCGVSSPRRVGSWASGPAILLALTAASASSQSLASYVGQSNPDGGLGGSRHAHLGARMTVSRQHCLWLMELHRASSPHRHSSSAMVSTTSCWTDRGMRR